MKQTLQKITKTLLFCFVIILSSCEKEGVSTIENTEAKNNNISIKYVSGKNIPNIINKLKTDYSSTFKSSSSKSNMITDSFGSISIENILEVTDSLGNKNYSFTLSPKKPKPNSIFNLVISTSNGNKNIAIVEYRMTPNFAQDYYNGTKSISEFTGSILRFPFKDASNLFSKTSGNTCIQNIDEVVNCDEIIVDGGNIISSGGGGGSTTISDTNTYTGGDGGTVTSNYGSGGGGSASWVCNRYGVSHSGPTNCGDGSGTWVIILYPDKHTSKLNNPKSKTSGTSCCDDTIIVGTVGVNLFDLAVSIRDILGFPPRSQEGLWLIRNATNDQITSISNFLEQNNNSTEAISFTKEITTKMMLNSDIFTSITPFLIEKIINDTQLNPCEKGVFTSVKNTSVCDIAQVLAKLDANGSLYNTVIKSEVAPNWQPAQTVWNSPYNYTVFISTDYIGKTKLFIAASIFHETVHAYFMSLFDDYHNANPQNLNAYNDFAGLFHYYVTLKRPSSINSADVHHQQMATDYVDAIARALQEYQTGIPVTVGTSPDQIYSDLAWGGLNNTPVFDVIYPVGNPNRQRILNRYQAEQQGYPAGQGTSQEQTPLGQPCN